MLSILAGGLRTAGLAVSIEELKDILWLAERLPAADGASSARGGAGTNMGTRKSVPTARAGEDEHHKATPGRQLIDPGLATDAKDSPLFSSLMGGTISASTLRVPGVASGEHPENLRRALQPFARRVASRWRSVIDEDEMASRAADTGVWHPVYQAVRERWFELSVIIESSVSMALWKETLAEFIRLLRSQGGFRSVTRFVLEEDCGLRADGARGPRAVPWSCLRGVDRPRLVLLITDATSPNWRNDGIRSFLSSLNTSASVTVMQVLPRRAWRHTALGDPDIELSADRAGETNARMKALLPWWLTETDVRGRMKLPVIGLDPDTIRRWASTMTSRGGATVPGVLTAQRRDGAAGPGGAHLEAATDATPAERIAIYRSMVSRNAYDLAVFLSVPDPLTVPVMRLVQRAMLPATGTAELAEFFAGGLLQSVGVSGAPAQPVAEASYRFIAGVREELMRSLRYSEEGTINAQLRSVGQYLVSHADEAQGSFDAYFPTPEGKHRLTQWSLPFASVSRSVLTGETTDIGEPPTVGELAGLEKNARYDADLPDIVLQIGFIAGENRLRFVLYAHVSATMEVETSVAEVMNLGRTALLDPDRLQDIANRLVPSAIQDGLDRIAGRLCLLADASLLSVPWELLLRDGRGGRGSVALTRPLLRTVANAAMPPRSQVRPPAVLWVVGDPAGDRPPLPAAQQEAMEVASVLKHLSASHTIQTHIRGESGSLQAALATSPYRAIFIAGHSARDPSTQEISGVLTGDRVIGVQELLLHQPPPELVFLAGSYLAELAPALLSGGVAAVVAAHDDMPDVHSDFIGRFFESLVSGQTFAEAVLAARRACFDSRESDRDVSWARYVAYGDPDYRLVGEDAEAIEPSSIRAPESVSPPAAAIERDGILILHTPSDAEWARRLARHIRSAVQSFGVYVRLVDDSRGLSSLSSLQEELRQDTCAVVPLLSPSYLISPLWDALDGQLFQSARTGELQLLWTLARECRWQTTPYASFQSANLQPLAGQTTAQADRLMRNVADAAALACQASRSADRDAMKPTPNSYPMVLVAGTGRDDLNPVQRQTSIALGAALAGNGYGLITGGWKGVDEVTARSFAGELRRKEIALGSRLVQVVPQGSTSPFPEGEIVTVEPGDKEYRATIKRAKVLIMIGGEGGTGELASFARQTGLPVLPLANTGGDALTFHDRIRAPSTSDSPGNLSEADVERLAKTAPGVVADVLEILQRLLATRPVAGTVTAQPTGSSAASQRATPQQSIVQPTERSLLNYPLMAISPPPSVLYDDGPENHGPYVFTRGRHKLRFSGPFRIGEYLVTNDIYRRFIRAGGYSEGRFWSSRPRTRLVTLDQKTDGPSTWLSAERYPPNCGDHPVAGICLFEVQAFLNWLQTEWPDPDWTWCLPTEDMWELSARSPAGSLYPWGNDFLGNYCNCSESGLHTPSDIHAYEQGRSQYGCVDMAGNVWEFVAATDNTSQSCILRGGSYKNSPSEVRSHLRLTNVPDTLRAADFGFRCAQVMRGTATGNQTGGARKPTNKRPLKKKSAKMK